MGINKQFVCSTVENYKKIIHLIYLFEGKIRSVNFVISPSPPRLQMENMSKEAVVLFLVKYKCNNFKLKKSIFNNEKCETQQQQKNTVNILPVFMVEKPPNKKNIKCERLFISCVATDA